MSASKNNATVDFDEYRRSILQKAGLASQIWEQSGRRSDPALGPAPLTPDDDVVAHRHKVIGELQHSFDLLNGKSPVNPPLEKPEFLKPETTRKKAPAPQPPKVKSPAPLAPPKPQVNGVSIERKLPPEVPKKPSGNKKILKENSVLTSPSDEFKSKNAYQKYIESFTHDSTRTTVKDFAENRFLSESQSTSTIPRTKQAPKVPPKKAKIVESSTWPPAEFDGNLFHARPVTPTGTSMGNKSARPKQIPLFENNSENQQKDQSTGKNPHRTSQETDPAEPQRPTLKEFERSRREAVKEQIPRTERLKQWNINDISPDSDLFPPKTRIQTLRRLSDEQDDMKSLPLDLNTELVQKKRDDFENGEIFAKSEARLRDQQGYWPGQEEGKLKSPIPGKARDLWEHRIQQHSNWVANQRRENPDSRRWKSLDALSASLLGTHSQDPWEIQAYTYRHNVHQVEKPGFNPEVKDPLFRLPVNYLEKSHNLSMDNLTMSGTAATIQREPTPVQVGGTSWYDQTKMKEAISHESIADLGQTKNKWERRVEESQQGVTPPPLGEPANKNASFQSSNAYGSTMSSYYFPSEHRTAPSGGSLGNSYYGPPAPETGRNLNIIEQEIRDYKIREQELNTRPVTSPIMTSGAGITNAQLEKEKDLLLIYLNTRPDVVNELGLILPHPIKQKFKNFGSSVPAVELREIKGTASRNIQSPIVMNGNAAAMNGFGYGYVAGPPPGGARVSSLERPANFGPAGRYVKNTQPSSRRIVRKTSMENSSRQIGSTAENRSSTTPLDDPYVSRGESLIAREIRELKDKEEELRRSRSELGLPTLEDTLETWRQSEGQYRTQIPLKGAQSYDHLHYAAEDEGPFTLPRSNKNPPAPGAGGMSLPFKAGSLDNIHQLHLSGPEEPRGSKSPPPGKSVGNGGKPGGVGKKSPYEMYLAAHHPSKASAPPPEFPPTNGGGKRHEYVPVESRIEAEVADLQQREAEIRQYRELYSPALANRIKTAESDQGSEDNISQKSAASGSETGAKSGEYVRQRSRGYKQADSGAIYDFRRGDNPDEMILVSRGRHTSTSFAYWNGHQP